MTNFVFFDILLYVPYYTANKHYILSDSIIYIFSLEPNKYLLYFVIFFISIIFVIYRFSNYISIIAFLILVTFRIQH